MTRITRIGFGGALPAAALAWALVVPADLAAQAAPQPPAPQAKQAAAELPDARSIIDRHIAAIGGREAVLAHSSSRVRGEVSMPANGLSGPIEIVAMKPNLALMRMTLTGIGDLEEGFNGEVGWMLSSLTGPMLTQGSQLDQKKFDSEFFGDLKDPARYKSITTVERTTFDGRDCYKIRLVSQAGVEDIEYYEVASGLKAGGEMARETPMGPISSTYTHADYGRFGKLLHPRVQKVSTMGVEQILTIASIEYDMVDPKVFELPASIKALLK